jgi:periplasmic mercuric ion binding protein
MKRFIPLALMFIAIAALGNNRPDPASHGSVTHAMISLPTIRCNTCADTIQSAVRKVAGVQSVVVDLKMKMVHVVFDSLKTSIPEIEKAIASIGYDANAVKRNEKAYAKLPKCCQ